MTVVPLKQAERPRSKFAPDRKEFSCAGQGCEERMRCQRYRRHAAWFQQKWASFDKERQVFGNCPAFERIA